MSLRSLIFDRYIPQNLEIQSEKTVENYRLAYKLLGMFLGREPELPDLNDESFAAYMTWLLRVRGLAAPTVNGYAEKLKAFWNWAAKKRIVEQFPTVGSLPEPEQLPIAWREDELIKIFNGCRSQRGFVGDVPAFRWWTTIHAWFWCTAERSGATFSLRVEHLNLSEGIARLPAEIRKGKRKPAAYHLWPDLVEMLRAMLPPFTKPRELVFDWDSHFDRGTFYNRYDKMLQRLNLPHDRKRKCHAMRISHASWLHVAGGDSTRALGHADPATTRKSYLDLTLDRPDECRLFLPWSQSPPPGS